MKGQSLELKKQKAEQAEARYSINHYASPNILVTNYSVIRLKYLLSQSDIFSHFGAVSAGGGVPTVAAPVANSKNSRRKASAEDELDEDEKRIAQELGDEEDTAEKKTPHTFLKVQPSCVSGGEMR